LNNRARWWIGIAISVLFLYLVIRGIDPGQFVEKLRTANYVWLLPAALMLVFSYLLRAWRWGLLLDHQVTSGRAFSVINVGYLLNNVLPFRLGDLARAYLISRRTPISAPRGLSSIVVERVLDLLGVVVLLAIVLQFMPPPALASAGGGILTSLIPAAGLTAAIATLAVFITLIVAAAHPKAALRVAERVLGRFPGLHPERVTELIGQLLEGLSALSDWRRLALLLAWTAAIWGVSILADWFVARAFAPDVSFAAAAFILALTGLGVSLPSSPGQIGVFEGPATWALQAFFVEQEPAVAVAFVLHGLGLAVSSGLGALFLIREGESLSGIAASARTWLARARSQEVSSPS
jgi:uncharacterized protein (TIRG00374 family)